MTAIDASSESALRAQLIALTRDLILIPGTASQPDDIDRGMAFVRNHLESLAHITLNEFRHRGHPSLIACPDGVPHPDILLCGHLDVIDHPDPAVYRSTLRDNRIYGAGAGDMKGALAILLELFRDFHTRYPSASLGLVITSDEETGGEAGLGYLVHDVGLRCKAAIIPDGGSLHDVTVEEKGLIHARLTAHGHAAHAARPWLGNNALEQLMRNVARVQKHFASPPRAELDEDNWEPTSAVTMMSTPNRTINRIPQRAEAIMDIRFPPPHTVDTIERLVTDHLDSDVTYERIISAAPAHLNPDPRYLEIMQAVTGRPARLVRTAGGSDARFFSDIGIPVMMSRPLVGELHSDEEWIDIASMITHYRICEQYLSRILL